VKYLLFSDIHCSERACASIVQRSADFDFAIGAGDFGLHRNGVSATIEALSGIEIPTIVVPGNHESHAELAEACSGMDNFHVLHGSGVRLGAIRFFGIGGGIPVTPFGPWSFDLSDDDAAALLVPPPDEFVFITHSPPLGCLDTLVNQYHAGSGAVRAFIERSRPRYVVCGHIHENAGRQGEVDGIPVINAGPAGVEFIDPGD